MKKLSKILLSFCMTFMLAFSLVACNDLDDDNYNDGSNSPSTVTMTEYAKNIYENHDYKSSYVASVISYEEDALVKTQIKVIKYKYGGNTAQIAVYNEEDVMTNYYEIETVVSGGLYRYSEYDLNNKTYTKKSLGLKEINARKANLYLADKIVMHMYQAEFNQDKEIGDDISELLPDGVVLEESITNPSTGKYILTRNISGVEDDIEYYSNIKMTCLNGKVVKYEQEAEMNGELSLDVSYEYKNVTIDIDTTLYTEAN